MPVLRGALVLLGITPTPHRSPPSLSPTALEPPPETDTGNLAETSAAGLCGCLVGLSSAAHRFACVGVGAPDTFARRCSFGPSRLPMSEEGVKVAPPRRRYESCCLSCDATRAGALLSPPLPTSAVASSPLSPSTSTAASISLYPSASGRDPGLDPDLDPSAATASLVERSTGNPSRSWNAPSCIRHLARWNGAARFSSSLLFSQRLYSGDK
mmetsp:Transcript_19950/g.49530  ORF Transcript_19950/g.49530 Transcript_19950/m.49530 type:complete len:212 (-) Transcript_19950:516-1151(-)